MSTYNDVSSLLQTESAPATQFVEAPPQAAGTRSRRNFLTTLGAGAVGSLALAGCANSPAPTVVTATANPPSVLDVLNFALNLEYLEASFYSYIASGNGLSSTDLGSGAGSIVGGAAKVAFSNNVVNTTAQLLAQEELQHVRFLRATITAVGGTPVSAPAMNLAALGVVNSDATFLALARQLETVGVSAYAGGAQYLTSSPAGLTYAAQILDTEAQHEGNLRQLCIALGVTSGAVDGLDKPPTSAAVFNTGSTSGLNPIRTTSQVLQIVYAAPGQTGVYQGGFFPQGLNGNIKLS